MTTPFPPPRPTRALTHPFSPTTTPLQATTYLIGVALFSISFLVFLNSSLSFVVTDLLGQRERVGDVVGTLGFADEIVALAACPAWGLVSDRLGVRWVAVLGYGGVAAGLVAVARAREVYPGLLMARVLFAVGATAAATMVTAILLSLTDDSTTSTSTSVPRPPSMRKPSVLAGYVGFFTGCGALVALVFFLPLPAWFGEHEGVTPAQAIQYSFYVVALAAACVAVFVAWGLGHLRGEENKGWRVLFGRRTPTHDNSNTLDQRDSFSPLPPPYLHLLRNSLRLGLTDPHISLGYLGGFVARASTVSISLFLPLSINTFFIRAGFCTGSPTDPSPDLKHDCRAAYVLAAVLTGSAQLVALLAAPVFGYLASRAGNVCNWPVIVAAASGVVGYVVFPSLPSPEFRDVDGRGGSLAVFAVMALLGVSQIGAIVCSLGSLGRGILTTTDPLLKKTPHRRRIRMYDSEANDSSSSQPLVDPTSSSSDSDSDSDSDSPQPCTTTRVHLKGSIAGIYSWCGAAAILLLTKLGGYLFDRLSVGAPFYMMAGFNAVLLVATVGVDVGRRFAAKRV